MKWQTVLSIVLAIIAAIVLVLSWQSKEIYDVLAAGVILYFAVYVQGIPS